MFFTPKESVLVPVKAPLIVLILLLVTLVTYALRAVLVDPGRCLNRVNQIVAWLQPVAERMSEVTTRWFRPTQEIPMHREMDQTPSTLESQFG